MSPAGGEVEVRGDPEFGSAGTHGHFQMGRVEAPGAERFGAPYLGRDIGLGAEPGGDVDDELSRGRKFQGFERGAQGGAGDRRRDPRLQIALHMDAGSGFGERLGPIPGDEAVDGPVRFLVSAGEPFQSDPGTAGIGVDPDRDRAERRLHEPEARERGDAARRGAQRLAPGALDFDDRVRLGRQPEQAPELDPPIAEQPVEAGRGELPAQIKSERAAGPERAMGFAVDSGEVESPEHQREVGRGCVEANVSVQPGTRSRGDGFRTQPEGAQTAARNPSGGAAHRPRLRREAHIQIGEQDRALQADPSFGERGAERGDSTEVLRRKRRRRAKQLRRTVGEPAPGDVGGGSRGSHPAAATLFGAARGPVEFHAGEAESLRLRHAPLGPPGARVEPFAGGGDAHGAGPSALRLEVLRRRREAPGARAALRVQPGLGLEARPGEPHDAELLVDPVVAEPGLAGEVDASVGAAGAGQVEAAAARPVRPVQVGLGGPQHGTEVAAAFGAGLGGRFRCGQHPARQRAGEREGELARVPLELRLPPAAFVPQVRVDLVEQQGALSAAGGRRRAPKPPAGDSQRSKSAVLPGEPEADLEAAGREDFAGHARDLQRHVLRDQRASRGQQVAARMQAPARVGDLLLQEPRDHPG